VDDNRSNSILIVDDDNELRDTLREVLVDSGFSVVTAVDGRDAIDRIQGGLKPGLILLDLMMPVMDGWQFLERRASDPAMAAIPVLAMTAARDTRDLRGVSGVLLKPMSLEALLAAIEAHKT